MLKRKFHISRSRFIELNEEMSNFSKDTAGESDLMVVLRGHIYIEHELEKMLELALEEPSVIFKNNNDTRIGFETKLKWAVAIGVLSKDVKAAYSKLNDLRNKYAHRLDAKLTNEDFNGIQGGFNKHLNDLYSHSEKSYNSSQNTPTWRIRKIVTILWLYAKLSVHSFKESVIFEYDSKKKDIQWKIEAADQLLSQEYKEESPNQEKIKQLRKDKKAFYKELKLLEKNRNESISI